MYLGMRRLIKSRVNEARARDMLSLSFPTFVSSVTYLSEREGYRMRSYGVSLMRVPYVVPLGILCAPGSRGYEWANVGHKQG